MSNDVPLLVQFDFEQGTLQFFLAPKVCLSSFLLPSFLPSYPSCFFPLFFLLLHSAFGSPHLLSLRLDPELTGRSPTSRRRLFSHLSIWRSCMLLDCFQIGHLGRPRFLGNIMNLVSIVMRYHWRCTMRTFGPLSQLFCSFWVGVFKNMRQKRLQRSSSFERIDSYIIAIARNTNI